MTGYPLPGTYRGFPIEKLQEFFELVKPRRGVINSLVHKENLAVTAAAIHYFTGVQPSFQNHRDPWYRVVAEIPEGASRGQDGQTTQAT